MSHQNQPNQSQGKAAAKAGFLSAVQGALKQASIKLNTRPEPIKPIKIPLRGCLKPTLCLYWNKILHYNRSPCWMYWMKKRRVDSTMHTYEHYNAVLNAGV
jgi:hypothetical protein